MKIEFRNTKGITLIALVITIIVLLILAGIAISMLTGDNGILTIAATSKEETEEAAVQEAIKLAYMNALAQYYEDGTSIVETMQEELESQYGEGNVTITETDGTYIVTIDGTEYTIEGISDGSTNDDTDTEENLISAADVAEDPETYLGAETDYDTGTELETDITWLVFYADEENIYLIADDYVLAEDAPETSSGYSPVYSSDYPYLLYLPNVYSDFTGSAYWDSKLSAWNATYLASYSTSTYINAKCVQYLLDTDLWSDFQNSTYADYAIASPTLEMWVASWNQYGYTTLYCDNVNSYGYYIGTSSSPTTSSQYVTSSYVDNSGYDNTLYFPHTGGDWNRCYGYWLASTNAYEGTYGYVMYVYCMGVVNYAPWSYFYCGSFRPVVCLSSDVQLQSNGDGTYSLIKDSD